MGIIVDAMKVGLGGVLNNNYGYNIEQGVSLFPLEKSLTHLPPMVRETCGVVEVMTL